MTSRLLPLSFFALLAVPALSWAQAAPSVTPAPASTSATAPIVIHDALPSAPAAMPAPVLTPDAPIKDDLGSTQLREAARIKAQIDLEKLRASLEDAQHSRVIAQRKFNDELVDKKDSGKGDGKTPAVPATPAAPKPYATSYYNFGGESSARLMFNGGQFVVSPGTVLPDGAKVESVSASNVVIRQNGRKVTVPYAGGGVGW